MAAGAESLLATCCREQARDDATAILMRNEACPEWVQVTAVRALETGTELAGIGVCGHLLITAVVEELVRAASRGDFNYVLRGVDALAAADFRPRRQEAMRVAEAFVDDGRVETMRAYRRVVEWVARI